ncbi:MAG: aminodeoxychorismate synthase component I [Bacteroidetes bacterium]|nr:aminodeoxychorismate synthase component I [Bacteroidota bacterium]
MATECSPETPHPKVDILRLLGQPGTVLLDGSLEPGQRCLLFTAPDRILSASRPADVPALLESVDQVLSEGWHIAGYLAYEAGYGFEPDRFSHVADRDYERELGYPIAWFGLYEEPDEIASADIGELFPPPEGGLLLDDLVLQESDDEYRVKVERIRELIRDGDVYQINLTGRFEAHSDRGILELYGLMRRQQPVSYGAFIQLGDVQILSSSPERFVEWEGGVIRAQPMKGTAPRGATDELDNYLSSWLRTDYKSRAENLMIVDLLRNDLSMVSIPGTVQVPRLFEVEQYATLFQMTSTIEAQLRPGVTSSELMSSLFPCGSVTGAPKIRAMRRILELESKPRGVYCGAIGHISPHSQGTFSVAIRTLTNREGHFILGAGGGIVWDSDSADELEEAVLKIRFLSSRAQNKSAPIEIIETMKWHDGIDLLDHHLARLQQTADRLGYALPFDKISRELERIENTLESGSPHVIRLLLGPYEGLRVEAKPLIHDIKRDYLVGISQNPVHSDNPFLQVKTTFRRIYEAGRREAEQRGLDEVLFLNEQAELTEGTITNVFLLLDGKWKTPRQSCGLLAGIGREIELGSKRSPEECILTRDDYLRAEEIVLTNAVRGRIRAVREENESVEASK